MLGQKLASSGLLKKSGNKNLKIKDFGLSYNKDLTYAAGGQC